MPAPRNILIVEDDEDLACFFQEVLHPRLGRVPETVRTVEAAVARLAAADLDAVIVDLDGMRLGPDDVAVRLELAAHVDLILIGSGLGDRTAPPGATLLEKPLAVGELWRRLEKAEPG